MPFDINQLIKKTTDAKERKEKERLEALPRIQAEAKREAEITARQEEGEKQFKWAVERIHKDVEETAARGDNKVIIGWDSLPHITDEYRLAFLADSIGVQRRSFLNTFPPTISSDWLTLFGQRVYDYCVKAGFRVTIENLGRPEWATYHIVIRW